MPFHFELLMDNNRFQEHVTKSAILEATVGCSLTCLIDKVCYEYVGPISWPSASGNANATIVRFWGVSYFSTFITVGTIPPRVADTFISISFILTLAVMAGIRITAVNFCGTRVQLTQNIASKWETKVIETIVALRLSQSILHYSYMWVIWCTFITVESSPARFTKTVITADFVLTLTIMAGIRVAIVNLCHSEPTSRVYIHLEWSSY